MLTEKKAKLLLAKAFTMKQKIDKATAEYNKIKASIYEFLEAQKTNSIETYTADEIGNQDEKVKATRVERVTSIKYDVDLLKKKIDKELFNEIVDKTYQINNIDAMIELLKKAGIKPKEFKKHITVSETINNGKIQQAYSVGDISLKDIAGAYQATVSQSLQIRKVSEKD